MVEGKTASLRAEDIMTRNPLSVDAMSTVQDAYYQLFEHDVRHVPVVKNGELVGIVSDRDVRSYMLPDDDQVLYPEEMKERMAASVSKVLQDDVICTNPDSEVREVVDLMLENKVGAVPVVDSMTNKLVGIISYVDVLRVARGVL